ncbi:MAG TPA: hypothetical protein VFB78_00960 [Acidimicrobiales bacterium]|nr:hypothetical protein [Acidimicrobiales bacterium]
MSNDSDTPTEAGSPGVPSTLLPLFPTTTTTRPVKATTTTLAVASGATVLTPPATGVYVYSVDGTETLSGSGSRKLPGSMRVTAQRTGAAADEIVLDLVLSDRHREREVLAYKRDGVALRYADLDVAFSLGTRASSATYRPLVARAVAPFASGATRSGVSEALDGAGHAVRTEDWKVTDVGPRTLLGVSTWQITSERSSRAGATEQLTESRTAWFDPARRVFVKWQTHLRLQRATGTARTYDLTYTAVLTGFTPA